MTVTDIGMLYDYSYWANAKLFRVLSSMTTDDFVRPVAGSWGSIRNTLVHMMSAEGGWLERAGGPTRGAPLKADDFPTLASVTGYWSLQEPKLRGFLATLSDADLARPIEYTLPQLSATGVLTIGEMLHHAVNHNIHHRAQVALLMRQLGVTPGNVDIMFYYSERRAVA
jgi:uncharacterized damage-inducible protein DinB